MIGLSLMFNSTMVSASYEDLTPLGFDGLVGWWDFTDPNYIYRDEGATKVLVNGDTIMRIDNKASVVATGAGTKPIGIYLQSSTSDVTKNPVYTIGGQNGLSYAVFDGSNDYLHASKVIGSTATNSLSSTTLNGRDMTVFFVVKHDGTSVSEDEYLFKINGTSVNDNFALYVDDDTNDRWEWDTQDDTDRTHTLINCGQDITSDTEYWTVELDSESSSSFYRNGDTSDGVTNGSTDDFDVDLEPDEATIGITVGGATTSSNHFDGAIYEIIIYDATLTDNEISSVEAYLSKKYAL